MVAHCFSRNRMELLNLTELRDVLSRARNIAIVGAKDREGQPVDMVGRYLIETGYAIFPVHPKRKSVWGLTAYPSLNDVPEPVDIVDLFRAPEYIPAHAREALRLCPPPALFWMQSGIASPEAEDILKGTSIRVVSDACLMVVHRKLFR